MDVSDPASVVLAPGTSAVLRALAGSTTSVPVRQLARVANVSHTRANQVIGKLSAHGLVHIEEQGGAYLCRLNPQHLAAAAVVTLVRLRTELLELLKQEIASWEVGPEHASLFGSAARGDGDTSSDLDILLIEPSDGAGNDTVWDEQMAASGERIREATGNSVAWFAISFGDLRRAVRANEPVLDEWRRDSLRLAGVPLRAILKTAS